MKITNLYSNIKNATRFILIFGLLLAFSVSAFGQQITISRPGSSMDYEIGSNNTWVHKYNSTYIYDNLGQLIERIIIQSPTNNSPNQNYRKWTYSYDVKGNETGWLVYRWDWSGLKWDLQNGHRYTNHYDASGKLTEQYFQYAGSTTLSPPSSKTIYTYNSDGTLSELVRSSLLQSGIWIMDLKITYNYSNGVNTSRVSEQYLNGTLTHQYRTINYVWHTLNDKPVSLLNQTYNNGVWENSSKSTYTYGPNGDYTWTVEHWQNGAWINAYYYSMVHDNHHNLIDKIHHQWDANTNNWLNTSSTGRNIYTYSPNYDILEKIRGNYDYVLQGIKDTHKEVYSNFQYFTITGQPEEATQLKVEVYPNPTSDFLTIQLPETKSQTVTATLTDVTGRKVLSQTLNSESPTQQINIEKLPAGIYLLQLQSENSFKTIKVIKQ